MLARLGLLVYAGILGLFASLALGAAASFFLSLLPMGAARAVVGISFGAATELLRFFVMGFVFWSGTKDTWKKAGAWVFVGGAVGMSLPLWRAAAEAIVSHPYWTAAVLFVWGAGAFLGAWFGDRTDDDARADLARVFIFRMYPFALPR